MSRPRYVTVRGTSVLFRVYSDRVFIGGHGSFPRDKLGYPLAGTGEVMVTPETVQEFLLTGKVDQAPQPCVRRDDLLVRCPHVGRYRLIGVGRRKQYDFLCDACAEREGYA